MSYTDFDFPHTSLYTSDLREVIANIRRLEDIVKTFVTTEQIKFADPILWNITTQYAKFTVVLNTAGNAYLSKEAVPSGIQLNNENYWQEIFNFTDYTRTANQNLTVNVETNTTRATANYQVDDWLIWEDVLYKVTATIAIDDALIVAPTAGANIIHFTVEDFIKAFMTWATNTINQYKDDIDASELAYQSAMQAEVDRILAGATVDSEVIDARTGYNGVTYSTLGNAIRTQIKNLVGAVNQASTLFDRLYGKPIPLIMELGNINANTGVYTDSSDGTRIRSTQLIKINPSRKYYIDITNNTSDNVKPTFIYYTNDGTYIDYNTTANIDPNTTSTKNFTTPPTAEYLSVRIDGVGMNTTNVITSLRDSTSEIDTHFMYSHEIITTPGTDLNDYVNPGMWAINDLANLPANCPVDDYFRLSVFATSSSSSFSTLQIVTVLSTSENYIRTSTSNGVWNDWIRLINDDFNYCNTILGSINTNTGAETASTDGSRLRTNYRRCEPKQKYDITISNPLTHEVGYIYGVFYDKDKNFISSTIIGTVQALNAFTFTFEAPYNAAFMRIRISNPSGFYDLSISAIPFVIIQESKDTSKLAEPFDVFPADATPYIFNGDISDYIPASAPNRTATLYAMYDALVAAYPDYITKTVLGRDATNTYDINLYTIEAYPNSGKPEVIWVSNVHGNEPHAAMATYYMVRELLSSRDDNPQLQTIFNAIRLLVVPLGNPYGYDHNTRNNGNDVNINRDFPVNWKYVASGMSKTDTTSMSQAETIILMNLLENHKDKCIFFMNRHDTGTFTDHSTNTDWWYFVGYMVSNRNSVRNALGPVSKFMDMYARKTIGSWLFENAPYDDWKKLPLYPIRDKASGINGTLDNYVNYVGVPSALLEQCVGAGSDFTDTPSKASQLLRMSVSISMNVVLALIMNNTHVLKDALLANSYAGYTGENVGGDIVEKLIVYNPSNGTWSNP